MEHGRFATSSPDLESLRDGFRRGRLPDLVTDSLSTIKKRKPGELFFEEDDGETSFGFGRVKTSSPKDARADEFLSGNGSDVASSVSEIKLPRCDLTGDAAGSKSAGSVVELDSSPGDPASDPPLLVYRGQSVFRDDYKTLGRGEFINDNIVNFYLTYLHREVLPEKRRDEVHVFSSHFFSCLRSCCGADGRLEKANRPRIRRWTKKVDVFRKSLVLVPVCSSSHWYLIVAAGLGRLIRPVEGKTPFLAVLDSLGLRHMSSLSKVLRFLEAELGERRPGRVRLGGADLPSFWPKVTRQPNAHDCGVFLMRYAEIIIKKEALVRDPAPEGFDLKFGVRSSAAERSEVAGLVRSLAGDDAKFPRIALNPEPGDVCAGDGRDPEGRRPVRDPKRVPKSRNVRHADPRRQLQFSSSDDGEHPRPLGGTSSRPEIPARPPPPSSDGRTGAARKKRRPDPAAEREKRVPRSSTGRVDDDTDDVVRRYFPPLSGRRRLSSGRRRRVFLLETTDDEADSNIEEFVVERK